MHIVVDDMMTHYERSGTGPVVIFLHGWGDTLKTFNALLQELPGYTTIRLDLPGFGATQAPHEVWNLDNYAQFVCDFVQKLAIKNFSLVGHSNGGAVAIRGVSLGLLKPDKLVLLAASGVRSSGGARRAALKATAKAGKAATFWLPQSSKHRLQKKFYGTIGSDMLVAPHLKETFKQSVRQDIQADAKKLNVPTLLIYGDQDRATPLATVGRILVAEIPDARLEVIGGGDHFLHQSHSQQIAEFMKDFLS